MGGEKAINRWDYLEEWVTLLFSDTPVYRALNFQPSPLTSGRGFMISIDCVAWTYSLIVIYEKN